VNEIYTVNEMNEICMKNVWIIFNLYSKINYILL